MNTLKCGGVASLALAAIWAIWQGIVLWRNGSGAVPELAKDAQAA